MTQHSFKTEWVEYCQSELAVLTPILQQQGFTLATDQPHLKGERFLQQAVTTTSGRKLILFGTDSSGKKVVIKATRDKDGQREIIHERECRKFLQDIDFAATVLHTPQEIAFIQTNEFIISIQTFIEQSLTFLERTVQKQFSFALSAFKAQEGTHATTFKHKRQIQKVYAIRTAEVYIQHFHTFATNVVAAQKDNATSATLFKTATDILTSHKVIIEQYGNFLTHTDFVPHNFRIDTSNTMYLLDHSSLTFGNKYEGWARFCNFMTLYNPELEKLLTAYVTQNRTVGEQQSLWLMRIYRLGEIIWYYQNATTHSEGNLLVLNQVRVSFWSTVLSHVLKKQELPSAIRDAYIHTRDTLRSGDEMERQQNLH